MIRPRPCALLLAVVCALSLPAETTKRQEVDQIFAAFNTHTPGCAVGVAERGMVVLEAGYGMADLERNVPVGADTVFESGSVAKQFTSAALILLAQQGKISLDDPLGKYLPELRGASAGVTVRQVMSHVSGLREWRAVATFGGMPEGSYVYTNQDLLGIAARQRTLNFDPGTNYSYTNTGYNIATILIERALGNGKTFPQFTQETIFTPLGMGHTQWRDNFRRIVAGRALAYRPIENGGYEQLTPIEKIIGAGGLLTTVDDLLKWNENFTHARVGGRAMVQLQETPATLVSGKTIAYAAGLQIETRDDLREVSHSGATGGYRTWLGRYPEKGVSVAVLCNSAAANPTQLGRATARLWTGAMERPPAERFAADAATLAGLAGRYRKLRDNSTTELRSKEGKLLWGNSEGAAVEFVPTGPTSFRAGAAEARVEAGTPPVLVLGTANGETRYVKVQPVSPTVAELQALVGRYTSEETASTLTMAVDGGKLTYRVGTGEPVALRATFRDGFEGPAGAFLFRRDASGKVVELSVGDDRAWDLRFRRVE